ncbi:hypothetical protein TPA0905_03660 [Streptomyces olivaceus]|nr:hypothetical protein TPA0905_03660 [Streptomyces olivaceus]
MCEMRNGADGLHERARLWENPSGGGRRLWRGSRWCAAVPAGPWPLARTLLTCWNTYRPAARGGRRAGLVVCLVVVHDCEVPAVTEVWNTHIRYWPVPGNGLVNRGETVAQLTPDHHIIRP